MTHFAKRNGFSPTVSFASNSSLRFKLAGTIYGFSNSVLSTDLSPPFSPISLDFRDYTRRDIRRGDIPRYLLHVAINCFVSLFRLILPYLQCRVIISINQRKKARRLHMIDVA